MQNAVINDSVTEYRVIGTIIFTECSIDVVCISGMDKMLMAVFYGDCDSSDVDGIGGIDDCGQY